VVVQAAWRNDECAARNNEFIRHGAVTNKFVITRLFSEELNMSRGDAMKQ
jgi:hypothetical protein